MSAEDAWDAIEDTLMLTGIEATPEALDAMAEASAGYPFMIQHVGYQAWREAKRRNPESGSVIQIDDVTGALPAVR